MQSRARPGHTLHLHGTAHSPAVVTPTRSSPSPNISPTPHGANSHSRHLELRGVPGVSPPVRPLPEAACPCGLGRSGNAPGTAACGSACVTLRGAGPAQGTGPASPRVGPSHPCPQSPCRAQAAPRTRSRSRGAAGRGCGCAASGTGCAGGARHCRLPGRGTWPAGTARARTAAGDEGGVRDRDRLTPATCSGPRSVLMCGPSSDSAVSQMMSPICPCM